jgi:hypothetical protein
MTLKYVFYSIAITAALLAQGCAGPVRKDAVPTAFTDQAVIPGMAEVRYRVGIDTEALQREGIASVRREQALLASTGRRGGFPPRSSSPSRAAATTAPSAPGC